MRIFHPEQVQLGAGVYIGHDAILHGYHRGQLVIGAGSWIGAQCFLHGAGGLFIGLQVGIGPGVRILTSSHRAARPPDAVLRAPLDFAAVHIEDGVDIGTNSTVLPGVRIGQGAIIGAGAVVRGDIPAWSIAAGVPARVLRQRPAAAPKAASCAKEGTS